MKKVLFFAAVLLVAAGCARELEITPVQEDDQSVAIEDPVSGVTIIRAGFEDPDTKSYIEMNSAGTAAKVLWSKGDRIGVYGYDSSMSYKGARVFSTNVGGTSVADFTGASWDTSGISTFYSFYPNGSLEGISLYKGQITMGIIIPPEQTATPNGIAEGLNLSYATSSSLTEDFVFHNIPSLIKFKLSGDVVPDLASIKFVANAVISGETIMHNLEDVDNLDFYNNAWYGDDRVIPSPSVVLNAPEGGFEAGVDYFIAAYPVKTEGFTMIFFKENGDYIMKTSSKTLDMKRSQIYDFGTVSLGSTFGDPRVTKYMSKSSSTPGNPVDIVVLPDGFTESEKDNFLARAQAGIDYMFDTEPYKTYKDYFNVYFIWEPSNESGATISDDPNGARDTAFGSSWGADSYSNMTANENKVYGFASAHCPEIVRGEKTIDEVPVLLIINDARYGGIAHSTSTGRTYCQVPYTYSGGSITWSMPSKFPITDEPVDDFSTNSMRSRTDDDVKAAGGNNKGDWRNTMLHEFGGHSFGRLKDEYWYESSYKGAGEIDTHSWPVPFGLNVTGVYDEIPWQYFLDNQDYIENMYNSLYSRIGVFQGGDVSIFNRWRSEFVSCMIDNRNYFSTWQRVLIVQRIFALAGLEFNMDNFLLLDEPADPKRDNTSLAAQDDRGVNTSGPVRIMPPLPPPVLTEVAAPEEFALESDCNLPLE